MKLACGLLLGVIVGIAGCKSGGGEPLARPGVDLRTLTVTSSAFRNGAAVPVDFTCDGADRSPGLTLSAPPRETRTLAIVVDDPDAPGGTFTHWLAYNLPADTLSVAEGAEPEALGGSSGTNDFGRLGYSGPCPPRFEEHHYRFRVFALDAVLRLEAPAKREALEAAMGGHLLGQGTLVGAYSH